MGSLGLLPSFLPESLAWYAGQYAAPTYTNYGDGYCTDSSLLGSGSNPTAFFTTLLGKEYVSQVMLAPHVSPS